ncbi:WG repeat-containing protein [Fluviicola taffensis]|uniref:KWG Leptospira repeat protein n=1 Tax=Fluviicola taffensis (strain DSM 16823 / NCIMB 13979 / RW262) TaxID=755732 RepID=F2IED0_FLUTR|nr:WG repeat-containing protein [Fluviicola taffensis]AEA43454.1 hypothetical protein Fluta_1460 [Fluviicola taffensis DSM 16823]
MTLTQKIITCAIVALISATNCAFGQLIPFCQKTTWGFSTKEGKVVIPCVYESVDFFSDDRLARVKKNGKYGYINQKGIVVIPLEYDDCHRIYEIYHSEYSVGIETNPSTNLNRNYDFMEIENPENNRYVVSKAKKFGVLGLIAEKPKVVIPFNYISIMYDPSKKVFHCKNELTMKYFNKSGGKMTEKQINALQPENYFAASFEETPLPVVVAAHGKYGVVRESSKHYGRVTYDTLVAIIYDTVIIDKEVEGFGFDEDFIAVKKGDKWGAYDDKKRLILPVEYDSINFKLSKYHKHWMEYNRSFYVLKNGKWGVLGGKDNSETLTVLLPFEYDGFSEIYYKFVGVWKAGFVEIFQNEDLKIITKKGYSFIQNYEHESLGSFEIFLVKNKAGKTVYLGENGVEFFTD